MFSPVFSRWGCKKVLCNWLLLCLQYVERVVYSGGHGARELLAGPMLSEWSQYYSFPGMATSISLEERVTYKVEVGIEVIGSWK